MARNHRKNFRLNSRSLITIMEPKSPSSEQYRTIRTNIEFSSVDKNVRSILITSSGPGEGKSTTAANLAVVFAQQGKRVLLIDSDLRKPTVQYTFQLDNTDGLTTVLLKQMSLKTIVQKCMVDNLDILTSGPIPPNPAELLSSKSMGKLLEDAYKIYDIIIFDSPPVLAVTDAQILANHTDGSLLVVSSGKTEKELAVKAKEVLSSTKSKLLGAVLNGKKLEQSSYYYYYGGK
ncbi:MULTISPECIES: CpsD/CapB family tyrosine-protein kinase [Bacillus]|nr:capsular exopolysaccharide synthesis family protein [Bacillus capparidis]